MASTSEKTFGSRLANAQKLALYLADFTSYVPATPAASLVSYQTLIQATQALNTACATHQAAFTTAANTRLQLFKSSPLSMLKRLAPINAYIKALYGKDSIEAAMIATILTKLRGESSAKFTKDAQGEWVSQSQRSFGSMTQNFSTLIDTLTSFGATYAPANPLITIDALTDLLQDLTDANDNVTTTYGALKQEINNRLHSYQDLSTISVRIKDTIQSIYGTTSSEYKLIRGLKI